MERESAESIVYIRRPDSLPMRCSLCGEQIVVGQPYVMFRDPVDHNGRRDWVTTVQHRDCGGPEASE